MGKKTIIPLQEDEEGNYWVQMDYDELNRYLKEKHNPEQAKNMLNSNIELVSIAKRCASLFSNEANYPEGTLGYRLKMDCFAAIDNAKMINK